MRHVHDPDANIDYARDWSAWLQDGETITTSTWVPDPSNPDAALNVGATSLADSVAVVWVSGGTLGKRYRLTNRITTSSGRTDERTDIWDIRNR